MYTRIGAPEMIHRKGHDRYMAPSTVHRRKALGMTLLVRVRSGAGVTVVVAALGTGLRLVVPPGLLVTGLSMLCTEGLTWSNGGAEVPRVGIEGCR
jgi:hypothetical protein